MRSTGPAVISCLVVLSACTEPPTEARSRPTARLEPISPALAEMASQTPPAGVPPEFQTPTELSSVEADAGWIDGKAYGGAIVRYTATHGHATATLTANGTSVSSVRQQFQYWPLYAEVQAPIPTIPMAVCQGTIRGDAYGRVWNEFVGLTSLLKWGERIGSDTKFFECPSPPPASPPSGGADERVCYTLEIDYYLYDPNTGRTEYLRTETFTFCKTRAYA